MKINCDKNKLLDVINIVQKAAATNSPTVALMGILLVAQGNNLTLTCNNLEIAIEAEVGANIIEEGSIVVNSKLFGDIVRKLTDGEVHITVNENKVMNITCGKASFEILGMSDKEFPNVQKISESEETKVKIPQKTLKELIKGTIFAAGTNKSKITLTGCLIEFEKDFVQMIAVDGYRLALRRFELSGNDFEGSLIVPASTLADFQKIINEEEKMIEISFSQKNIIFSFDNVRFFARVIEGDFIDYKKIMPTSFETKIKVDSAEFEAAIERAATVIMIENANTPIKINIEKNKLRMSCETGVGKSDEEIIPEIEGNEIKIGFNHRYLLDAVNACPDENFYIGFGGGTSPCLIYPTSDKNHFKYIILPVRL